MTSTKIIIALPRGRIIESCKNILNKTSFSPDPSLFDDNCRKLTFTSSDPDIDFIKVRAFDVCTFVAFGAAQIGIAGDDVVQEFNYSEVYAPLDLNIGHCRLSVAAPKIFLKDEDPSTWSNIRIATKYPNLTNNFFASRGVNQYKLISSLGATETYPFTGSSEIISDITSTGSTIKANNLRVLKDGNILKSYACVFTSKKALLNKNKEKIINLFLKG